MAHLKSDHEFAYEQLNYDANPNYIRQYQLDTFLL